MNDVELWQELGQQLRVDAIRPAAKAGSGHPTSGMSAADLMAVLLAKYLRYDYDQPHDPHNDRLVFSKGHASTLVYAMLRAAGAITEDELLTYRQFDSIFEVNRLGQRGETMHGWDLDSYTNRAKAFGCHTIEIDGHDVEAIDRAYAEAIDTAGQPVVIVAKTIKGKGDPEVEDKNGFHGKALDHSDEVIAALGGVRNLKIEVAKPETGASKHEFPGGELELPRYEVGDEVATRKAYGDALAALGKARGDVVALDGEVSNSTFAEEFRDAIPDRYFEMYIAEQQMVATAVGMQALGWRPFASTFAAFLSRAYDFIRMSAISRASYCLCGSHAGISIGEDGPSQMALEDIASLRAVHGSTVLHPCDANQPAKLVEQMADVEGISYLRTLRPNTPVVYGPDEEFPIGGSRTLREGDDVTLVGCGITVHEALKAADE